MWNSQILMECRIHFGETHEFGIRNPRHGIRDSLFGIQTPWAGIWNPRATWITLHRASLMPDDFTVSWGRGGVRAWESIG